MTGSPLQVENGVLAEGRRALGCRLHHSDRITLCVYGLLSSLGEATGGDINEWRGWDSHGPLRLVWGVKRLFREKPPPLLSDGDKRCALCVVHPVDDCIDAGMVD